MYVANNFFLWSSQPLFDRGLYLIKRLSSRYAFLVDSVGIEPTPYGLKVRRAMPSHSESILTWLVPHLIS